MPARSMASATVSFGLVSIPVKLYSTSDTSKQFSLNYLHEECGSRIKYRYYCPSCDTFVERDELVRGYEFAKDQYVLFDPDELDALTAKATHSIDIEEFVPLSTVDPIYFEKPYYIGPGQGGERPYHLLAEVMRQAERAAVARYAARGKEYLVLLRAVDDGLLMQQLRYDEHVRSFDEVPIPDAEVKDAELELAQQIVEQNTSDAFEAGEYRDEYTARMLELIQQKIEGKEITAAPEEAPKAQVIDLMEALKASLGEDDEEEAEEAKARKGPKRAPAKKKAKAKKAAAAGKKGKKSAKK